MTKHLLLKVISILLTVLAFAGPALAQSANQQALLNALSWNNEAQAVTNSISVWLMTSGLDRSDRFVGRSLPASTRQTYESLRTSYGDTALPLQDYAEELTDVFRMSGRSSDMHTAMSVQQLSQSTRQYMSIFNALEDTDGLSLEVYDLMVSVAGLSRTLWSVLDGMP